MNSDKIKIKDNFILKENNNIINQKDEEKDEKNLLNILTNENLFNDRKTKIIFKKEYECLIEIFKNANQNEFINMFNYLNEINIPIIKILIVGFIEFEIEKENIILEIISKGINLCFNINIFIYIYKKLSKQFRRHYLINDSQSIKKFEKLFQIWKLLYSTSKPIYDVDLNNSSLSFIFFPNLEENKKYIVFDIIDNNKMQNLIICINFVSSPILNVNKIINNFSFMKLYGENDEIFELKYNDIISNNNITFSEIFKIKFEFSLKSYDIYINKKIKIFKNNIKFNFNLVTKIELLNNFFGEVSSIVFKKKYETIAEYEESCPIVEPLKMKIYKENINNDKVKIKTNAYGMYMNDEKENIIFENIFSYQYCGASFSIKINNDLLKENDKNLWKKSKIDLSNIEYLGGLNSFIPLFKIIKNIIHNLTKNKNIESEKEKKNFLLNINNYVIRSFIWIKDILKIMFKMICLSEKNYKNFTKIIVPLIGSIAEISDYLNNLYDSNLITKENISFLFNDEIFSSLYILILISSLPNNIKEIYRKIVGINKNLDNLNLSLDSIIFDIHKNKINNLDWYFTILIAYIEFILIYFNSSKKLSSKIIIQINSFLSKNIDLKKDAIKKQEAINILTNVIQNFYNEDKKNFENIIKDKNFLNDNNYYFQFIIYMLTSFLNIKKILKKNKQEFSDDSFYYKFLKFFENYFSQKEKINITDDYVQMIINLKYFPEEITFLQQLFPFLSEDNFNSENELIMDELIDYQGEYHHLMKELFIFNRLWSNRKVFYNITLEKKKKTKLKYKNINYYTRNFQRPIIYPVLDYKKRYPNFSKFKIDMNFYNTDEDKDDYNFDLDSPKLDKYIEEYNKEIFEKIQKNGKINICEVCLVKQTHHVKGNLFIFYNDNKIIIYFYSYPYNIQINEEGLLCCNKGNEEEGIINNENNEKNIQSEKIKNNLCYGAIFSCPKKDANKKIKIELNDIRLVLSRIYFYRNSALEIFTDTKSYYFNFFTESKKHSLICTFMYPCEHSYFPINVDGNHIGYMKLNPKIIDKNKFENLINKNNNFIEFISSQTSKGGLCEMCNFDIIMIINLISNRSYNDLYQYPIFPLLYFYDKQNNIVNRDFKEHIGFQELSEKSKLRKTLILKTYQESINEANENNLYENENQANDELYCFNTHYSNSIYISNYLIRLFPYSFSAIELQGNGFDTPNRLFFSIEDTFYNISAYKSDLRELIPEFFYLPEMFMNINSINFHKRSNDELVDDVLMPHNVSSKNINNLEFNEVNMSNSSFVVLQDNNMKKENNYKKCFIFTENMKNKLENLTKELGSWINIIFGLNQRKSLKNQQYFRPESFINLNNKYKNYLNDNIIMESVEFGIIPLQTIFDNKILSNLQKRKSSDYEKFENKEANTIDNGKVKISKKYKKKIKNFFYFSKGNNKDRKDNKDEHYEKKDKKQNDNISRKYFNNEYNDYWDESINIDFIINNNNLGKLEIYKNNILIDEIIDHNDIIIDLFYNRRLNMFATTSYDSFIYIYILPNKLFSMIKHPKNLFYDNIFLSANPFPTVIGYEKNENILTTYSLSGMLIKRVKIDNLAQYNFNEIELKPIFNIYGGAFKDKLQITIKFDKKIINEYYSLPFFEIEYKEILNE